MGSPLSFVHPKTQKPLLRLDNGYLDASSGQVFQILSGIPRFCIVDNYSESFGYQWNQFARTQIDSYCASTQSESRFYLETGWAPCDLSTATVLEVGSGAGRFSEVFLRTTTGFLHSVDYSSAVDANLRNNYQYSERLQLSQASIYELPYADNTFDRVFCLGVLQHIPSFSDGVSALIAKAKPGGEIVVDFYPVNGWWTKLHAKYLLRPFTKRLPKPLLLRLIRQNIVWMLLLSDALCYFRLSILTRFIPITDVRLIPESLSPLERREWAVMDTFDCFSPEFDNPQSLRDVVKMFTRHGCAISFAGLVQHESGIATVVRAVKQHSQSDSQVPS